MKKTVSGTYTLSYLVSNPKTRDMVYKHLKPLFYSEKQLQRVHGGTLRDMFERNMGGGLPYDVITALMKELDELQMPLENIDDKTTGKSKTA